MYSNAGGHKRSDRQWSQNLQHRTFLLFLTCLFTFHRRGLVDEEVSVPNDGEVHREVPGIVPFIPILRRRRHRVSVCGAERFQPKKKKRYEAQDANG